MPEVVITKSKNKAKRFAAHIQTPGGDIVTVNFGSRGGKTFIDHGDAKKKANWIARHSQLNENWEYSGHLTPGFWSRWLLWNSTDLATAARYLNYRFGLDISFKL